MNCWCGVLFFVVALFAFVSIILYCKSTLACRSALPWPALATASLVRAWSASISRRALVQTLQGRYPQQALGELHGESFASDCDSSPLS